MRVRVHYAESQGGGAFEGGEKESKCNFSIKQKRKVSQDEREIRNTGCHALALVGFMIRKGEGSKEEESSAELLGPEKRPQRDRGRQGKDEKPE